MLKCFSRETSSSATQESSSVWKHSEAPPLSGSTSRKRDDHQCSSCTWVLGHQDQQPAPSFTYCGVDYFGPWRVKEGCRQVKRYRVLFTRLASPAIHVETLDASSFINDFWCFVIICEPIQTLRSDQGTNFIDALKNPSIGRTDCTNSLY